MSEQINKPAAAKEVAQKRKLKSIMELKKIELPEIPGYRTRVAPETELNKYLSVGYEVVTKSILRSFNIPNPFEHLDYNASEGESIKMVLNKGQGAAFRHGVLVMLDEEIAKEHDAQLRAQHDRVMASLKMQNHNNIFSKTDIT